MKVFGRLWKHERERKAALVFLISVLILSVPLTGLVSYRMAYAASPPLFELHTDDWQSTASYVIKTDGASHYWAVAADGSVPYSGTNATTILNSAIASSPNGIFIKSGEYDDIGQITLYSNTKIIGENTFSTIFKVKSSPTTMMFTNLDALTTNIELGGFTIDGLHEPNINASELSAIYLSAPAWTTPSSHINLHDIYIKQWDSRAIIVSRTWYANLDNIIVDDGSLGISIAGVSQYCTLSNIRTSNNLDYGVSFASASHCVLTGYTSYNDLCGLELAYFTRNITCIGTTICHASWVGILIAGSQYNTISGFSISQSEGNAIDLRESGGYNSIGNTISDGVIYNSAAGIALLPNSDCNTISNVNIDNNGRALAEYGILIQSNHNTITGGLVRNTKSAAIGIYNATFNIISGTQITDTLTPHGQMYGIWEVGTSDWNMLTSIYASNSTQVQIKIVGANTKVACSYNGTSWVA